MSSWILASGGNEFSAMYSAADLAALSKRTNKKDPLLVVVTAPFPTQLLAYKAAETHFASLGIETIMSPIFSENDLTKENIEQLEQSSSIYFAGGTPARLIKAFIDTAAEDSLRTAFGNGAVFMGSSAGAMFFGARVVMPGGNDIGRGLNILTNKIVLAHFALPWPNWAKALHNQGFELLGLSEGGSVLTPAPNTPTRETFGEVNSL